MTSGTHVPHDIKKIEFRKIFGKNRSILKNVQFLVVNIENVPYYILMVCKNNYLKITTVLACQIIHNFQKPSLFEHREKIKHH